MEREAPQCLRHFEVTDKVADEVSGRKKILFERKMVIEAPPFPDSIGNMYVAIFRTPFAVAAHQSGTSPTSCPGPRTPVIATRFEVRPQAANLTIVSSKHSK